jgi:alkanesulfonate monooxygenase SsuD/methylene tetrahydromethanopterin reductase-like flavin-dependent oxidoreductase (luciferase family)
VSVIKKLLAGDTVTHRGRINVVEAKLYSLPDRNPALLGAGVTQDTAKWVGSWADGFITIQATKDHLIRLIDAYRAGGGDGKPLFLQVALCWAPSEAEAEAEALNQWGPNALGGEVSWDLRRPADFDRASRFVSSEDIRKSVLVSSDLGQHRAWLAEFVELGFTDIYLHQVGRRQEAFIEKFASDVLPQLRGR